MLKVQGVCACLKPTKKVEGRNRWLKTCGDRACSHALHITTMTTLNEDGVSKADLRSRKIHETLAAKDPDYKRKWSNKLLSTLGEDGLAARGKACSETRRRADQRALVRYRSSVSYYTRKQDLSVLENIHLLKDGYQIDHILSVVDGFLAGLPTKVVAHKANLQVLSRAANRAKYTRSDQTVEDLLGKINGRPTLLL